MELSDGRTLHVYDTGTPGHPVIWNHGTPNIGAPPEPLFAAAERLGLRWVSFDRPGYGGSTVSRGRTVASVARDTEAVADALSLDRFAVAGYSGGGTFALGTAALLGDRVTAAMTLAAIAPYGVEGLDWYEGMVPSGIAALASAAAGARETLHNSGFEYDAGFTAADEEMFGGPWGWLGEVAGPGLDAGPYGQIDDDVSYTRPWGCDPRTITAPTLLLHGTCDRIIPPSHASWLAAHCPAATLQLHEGASHFTIVEYAEAGLSWLARR
ncbi:alpha/beta fold hydrolase [Kribbella antibiotica]|nr:alpha/beta hydrolase [Kribbella antibiotica]